MEIDVVIPTANNITEKKFSLYYTIRSVLAQSVQPKNIIIVVNSTNSDNIFEKIKEEFGKTVVILDGTKMQNNISFARNVGAQYGGSEIILFMDDDVVIANNDSLFKISQKMQSLDFYCAAHRFWTNTNWEKMLRRDYTLNHIQHILTYKTFLPKSIERLTGKQNFHEYSFIGHFGAITRSVFNEIGAFDENYLGWSYQDTDLMMRLCKANYRHGLMYLDGISVFHLSHGVDKSKSTISNKNRFLEKQSEMGIKFHLNHFFGVFDDDEYSILT